MKILLAGGGTGGHIYPLLAVAEELKKIASQYNLPLELHYMGPIDQHSLILKEAGIKMHSIITGKVRRYFSLMNLIDIPKFFIGSLQTLFKLLFLMPDIIFSKGGPGAFQVVSIGWFYSIKSVIHESDAAPGLTNLLSSRFASKICVSFESATKYFNPNKLVLTGNPVRKELIEGKTEHGLAKIELGFKEEHPLLVVLGGSQGSQRINEFMASVLPKVVQLTQVLHQTGTNNFDETQKLITATKVEDVSINDELQNRYEILPYLDLKKMRLALSAADIVVGRAGSGTIFELASFGVPSILIPLKESANDHQRENAYAFAEAGGATVIEEINLTEQIFISQVKNILNSQETLAKMAKKAGEFAKLDAPTRIAEEIIALVV